MALLANNSGQQLVDWRDTVLVEHCDRISRLWQLSARSYFGAPPQFFDGDVDRSRLPAGVGVTMPILRVVFPERVFFDTDQSMLRPEAREVVRIIARNLQLEPPDVAVFVAGHADARGDREYNLRLSVERANAVAEAIANEGVNVASVWRVGFGEDMPLVAGDSLEAYGQNRRVEFLFAGRPEVVASWLSDAQLDMLCGGASRSETNACLTRLELHAGYDAVELASPARATIAPGAYQARVAPQQRTTRLDLTAARRIRIDPVNRRSGPVELPGRGG